MMKLENVYYIPVNADLIIPIIETTDKVKLIKIGDGFYQPSEAKYQFRNVQLLPYSMRPGEGIPSAWRKPVRWFPEGLEMVAVMKSVRTVYGIQTLRILAVVPE